MLPGMNAAQTFYFYDLETSGISSRTARVMQFAGQRTDLDLNPIGEPHNISIILHDDVLPDIDAVLITGITPQQTHEEGITEVEFLKVFQKEIVLPGTIFVGFNTVRFDDEFMRFMLWRNFLDAYTWQWQDDRSRWDLLDVVRMMRALRPEGIVWPVDGTGKATNRLELLTAQNGLDHANAHDALSDVQATIDLAKFLRAKQPKLFDYLLGMRAKKSIEKLVMSPQPFVYSSGKYPTEFEKTTVVVAMAKHPNRGGALVYDLRHDPTPFAELSAAELADRWRWQAEPDSPRLPVKSLLFNRCPAVAPMGVLDPDSQKRLHIDLKLIQQNLAKLLALPSFTQKVLDARALLDAEQKQTFAGDDQNLPAEARLYDGFVDERDTRIMQKLQSTEPAQLMTLATQFGDERLQDLLLPYVAHNYPKVLTDQERTDWETYKQTKLLQGEKQSALAKYLQAIHERAANPKTTDAQKILLEDLRLYGESLLPDLD